MRPWLLTVLFLLIAGGAWAARPLTVDDSGAVPVGMLEFEAGVNYAKSTGTREFEFPLALTTGIAPDLAFSLASGGVLEEREETLRSKSSVGGLADLVTGVKWNPLKEEQTWAALALAGSLKLPTADRDRDLGSGKLDSDLTLLVSRYWETLDNIGTHLNVGYTWIGADIDVVHYGVAFEWPLHDRLCLVSEVFADTPVKNTYTTGIAINGGLQFVWFDGLTV